MADTEVMVPSTHKEGLLYHHECLFLLNPKKRSLFKVTTFITKQELGPSVLPRQKSRVDKERLFQLFWITGGYLQVMVVNERAVAAQPSMAREVDAPQGSVLAPVP
jgi:hypothetical protein